jgi:hypothetical protein
MSFVICMYPDYRHRNLKHSLKAYITLRQGFTSQITEKHNFFDMIQKARRRISEVKRRKPKTVPANEDDVLSEVPEQEGDPVEMDVEAELQEHDSNSDQEEQQPAKKESKQRIIKPKGKKGKKFPDNTQMQSIIDSICHKEEAVLTKKTEKMKEYKKVQDEFDKKVKQRRLEKKLLLKEKKRELKGGRKPANDEDHVSEPEDITDNGEVQELKVKKKVSFVEK